MMKGAVKAAVRVAVSAVLLAWAVHRVGGREVLDVVLRGNRPVLAAAALLYGVCQLTSAVRWSVVLAALGSPLRPFPLFGFYLVGMFFSQFLPGSVGGDAVKAVLVVRATGAAGPALLSVVVERCLGLVALLTLFALGLAASRAALPAGLPLVPSLLVVLTLLLGMGTLMWPTGRGVVLSALQATTPILGSLARRLVAPLERLDEARPAMVNGLALSALVQLLNLAVYALLARALGFGPRVTDFMIVFYPIVTMVALLPLALAGVGMRESAAPLLLATVGLSRAESVALTLAWTLVTLPWALAGGVLFAVRRERPRWGAR
jgi:uncharacterized protein (TIRG00374 family)